MIGAGVFFNSLILYLLSFWTICDYISVSTRQKRVIRIWRRKLFLILISRNLNQQSHSFSLPCFDYISCNMVLPISSLTINIIWSICPTNTIFRTSKITPNVVFTNIWIFCFLSVRSWPLTNTERALSSQLSIDYLLKHFLSILVVLYAFGGGTWEE